MFIQSFTYLLILIKKEKTLLNSRHRSLPPFLYSFSCIRPFVFRYFCFCLYVKVPLLSHKVPLIVFYSVFSIQPVDLEHRKLRKWIFYRIFEMTINYVPS